MAEEQDVQRDGKINQDDREEFGAKIGGQSINFKGSTTQFLVLMVVMIPVICLSIVLYFLYQHEQNTKIRTDEGHKVAREFVGAVKDMGNAQRNDLHHVIASRQA